MCFFYTEEENKPADLTQRVIFRSSKKSEIKSDISADDKEGKGKKRVFPENKPKPDKKQRKENKKSSSVLSFDADELDEH